jgi:hypothetical protein
LCVRSRHSGALRGFASISPGFGIVVPLVIKAGTNAAQLLNDGRVI